MFSFKSAIIAALALLVFQPMPSLAVLLPAGNYALSLTDCMGPTTSCTGSISTYDVQTLDGNLLSVDGISAFEMNFASGQVMKATGPAGVAIDPSGTGFGILPVTGGGLKSYRFAYPIFPIVLDTSDFTARELVLTTQELGNDLFLRYSLRATRFLSTGVQELRIFTGYANYTPSQTLPEMTDALQLSIIADDIKAHLEDQNALADTNNWLSLVSRDELILKIRAIDAGTLTDPSVSFELDGRYGVPEPSSLALLSLGMFGIGLAHRRRRAR